MERLDFKKDRVNARYKTIYLKEEVIDKIEKIAYEEDTSFNNVIATIIKRYLELESQNR